MTRKFIEKLENEPMTFVGWVVAFTGVVAVRFLFETFSSPSPGFPAALDAATMVHYFLFYVGAFVSSALLVNLFVPDIARITKVLIFISPILWLPPLFDLVGSGGGGYAMAYIFASGRSLTHVFLTFGGSSPFGGMTPGIRMELAVIIVGVAWYVFLKTRNIVKTVAAGVLCYCLVLFWMAIPSLLSMATSWFDPAAPTSPSQVFNAVVGAFSKSNIPSDIFRPVEQVGYAYGVGRIFNAGVSHLFYVIDSLLLGLWFFSFQPRAAAAVLKNVRPGRMLHFWFMILVGAGAAALAGGKFFNWVDGMALVTVLVSFLSAWLFAVGTNDAVDLPIDAVSNPNRPLVAGTVSGNVSRATNIFFLAWSLIGAFVAGYWTLFLVIVFLAAYYVYSVPPLRLKRVPILATFLVAVASLSAAMTGFYFLSPGKLVGDFPHPLFLVILIFFTLFTNIKDIKDVAGDRADSIATIPTVFGEKIGRRVIGLLCALAIVLIGAIVRSPIVTAASAVAAIAVYCAVAIGTYREWRIFAIYFAYAVAVIVALVISRTF